jgi:hypothetical protein
MDSFTQEFWNLLRDIFCHFVTRPTNKYDITSINTQFQFDLPLRTFATNLACMCVVVCVCVGVCVSVWAHMLERQASRWHCQFSPFYGNQYQISFEFSRYERQGKRELT